MNYISSQRLHESRNTTLYVYANVVYMFHLGYVHLTSQELAESADPDILFKERFLDKIVLEGQFVLNLSYFNMLKILNFRTDRSEQTTVTKIRLRLKGR